MHRPAHPPWFYRSHKLWILRYVTFSILRLFPVLNTLVCLLTICRRSRPSCNHASAWGRCNGDGIWGEHLSRYMCSMKQTKFGTLARTKPKPYLDCQTSVEFLACYCGKFDRPACNGIVRDGQVIIGIYLHEYNGIRVGGVTMMSNTWNRIVKQPKNQSVYLVRV